MSEINNKIRELHRVDMLAGREGWLSGFHPLAKVLVTVIYILTVVSFDKYDLAGLLPMAVYLIIVMSLHGLNVQRIWKKARWWEWRNMPRACIWIFFIRCITL